MMHTNNHEPTLMASKFFPDLMEAGAEKLSRVAEAPRPRPLDENAAGAHPSGPPPPEGAAAIRDGRCKEKGCIFPATEFDSDLCLCHFLQKEEPQFFHTRQPSLRLLEIAKYGMTTEDEDTRIRRRRQAEEMRQLFLKGMA